MTTTLPRHTATRSRDDQTPPPSRLPRLLATGAERRTPTEARAAHLAAFGQLPTPARRGAHSLIEAVTESDLRGRGGGGFPTGRKMAMVARAHGSKFVVCNATEGEPLSRKDELLLWTAPHLIIDGLLAAAHAVGARQAMLVVSRGNRHLAAIEAAVDLRTEMSHGIALTLHHAPERFVVGEESALVNWLNGGPAKPTVSPPRPGERGVKNRPTLVLNAETLSNVALIARYGARWFRSVGTEQEPGSALLTVAGAVHRPGVVEVALGTPLDVVLDAVGGVTEPIGGFLVGGYFGTWLRADDPAAVTISHAGLRAVGSTLGAGTIGVFPAAACPVHETARVLTYLAGESAGQCGPCVFGLPAVAQAMARLAAGHRAARGHSNLLNLAQLVERRGACALPDGAARLVRSLWSAFPDEVQAHLAGRCSAAPRNIFPIPRSGTEWR